MDPQSSEPAIRIDGATRRFGDTTAVDSIDLIVEPGTILGVIGPSGSGKTTTIRMLTGALIPSDGRVRVLGEDPRHFTRQTRQRIGYMPQQFTLYPDLTARENVDFVASLYGILWRTRHRRTRQVLELVELWDARSRQAGDLSGGMQRRLELACALVHEPTLLFLDEPTAGIDPLLRATIWEELHRLRDAGRTLLVTTQYVNEAEGCDTVALIASGRLVALAPPEELRREAMGGDVIDLSTVGVIDGRTLSDIDGVLGVHQDGPRHARVVVDDASTALPELMAALTTLGVEVETAAEARPSFDEVFGVLVERDEAAAEARAAAAAEADGTSASSEAA